MESKYIPQLDKTMVTFELKIATLDEVPAAIVMRKTVTQFELLTMFDVTIADDIVREVKGYIGLDSKIRLTCVGRIHADGLYIHYVFCLDGKLNVYEIPSVHRAYHETQRNLQYVS